MEISIGTRIKHAWNAFMDKNNSQPNTGSFGGYYTRPDRIRLTRGNERSIVTSVFNRIALDVTSIDIKHCKKDEQDRYKETVDSKLNNCLTLESNIDQNAKSFLQDIVMSMFDDGCVAIVPVDTTVDPSNSNAFDVLTLRTGRIVEWYPDKVKVSIYNDRTGNREDVILGKSFVAIVENPLYAVMNEPNSTLQRLMRKLVLLDAVDEQTSSGKLDLIIQLPYIVKTEARRSQAEKRRQDIEKQLSSSKYGIAYIDGTEKVTQLNRALENNLMKQIEYLTSMLYSQLGITAEILNGTANEEVMLNYYSRTINPIITAITMEMERKFLSKTARTQKQCIMAFRDPFKLVPMNKLAELADKFTRNEILSSNEVRGIIGYKPSDDPNADRLRNSNLNHPDEKYQTLGYQGPGLVPTQDGDENNYGNNEEYR